MTAPGRIPPAIIPAQESERYEQTTTGTEQAKPRHHGLPLEASQGGIEDLRRDIQRPDGHGGDTATQVRLFPLRHYRSLEELATLFHDDVTVHFIGGSYQWNVQGKQDYVNNRRIVQQGGGRPAPCPPPEIQMLSETEATAIWYLEDNMWILNHNARTRGTALYWDRYLKVNGKWLIKDDQLRAYLRDQ